MYSSTIAVLWEEKVLQIINGGKTKFSNDLNIIISEINIYLATNEIEKAQSILKIAIEKDPNNHILYYTVGSNYDKLSQKEDISEEQRATLITEAKNAYQKAIEIKPDYFDAYYNLGALLYNEGVHIFSEAQKISPEDIKGYTEKEKEFKETWKKSLPYLEKAHELDPNDIYTLNSLREVYSRLSMNDKFKEINEKLNQLK